MIVRMRIKIGGYRDLQPWPEIGDTIELPDAEAADLIANGYAEEATDEPIDEPATDDGEATADDAGAPARDDVKAPSTEPLKPKAARKAPARKR